MRAFIAIEISDEIKSVINRVESHLKYADADIKWVKPEAIHLTLKFLGEITDKQKVEISAALDGIAEFAKTFDITLNEIGAFPTIEYPRVIWVGIGIGADESVDIAGRVDERLSSLGFSKEPRAFIPHLTIGRVNSPRNISKLRDKLPGAVSDIRSAGNIAHRVASLVLFQSTLTPHGSIYSKLHESHFAKLF